MAKIYENIAATLDRADEVPAELLKEYDQSLERKRRKEQVAERKHIDLVPQKRTEERRTTATSQTGK